MYCCSSVDVNLPFLLQSPKICIIDEENQGLRDFPHIVAPCIMPVAVFPEWMLRNFSK